MSYTDTRHHAAPFGAITIYRAVSAFGEAADSVLGLIRRRAGATPAASGAVARRARPGIVASLRAWKTRRRTIAQLGRLSDRQLDDIGLNRMAIEALRFGRPLV